MESHRGFSDVVLKLLAKIHFLVMLISFCWIVLATSRLCKAEDSPEDHEKHHSSTAEASTAEAKETMGGMGKMMEGMSRPAQKEFYPEMMTLPALSDDASSELEGKARKRIKIGTTMMNQAFTDLAAAAEEEDFTLMREASESLNEGLAQFDSGVSTLQALAEGKSPRSIGLSWFKNNLGLDDHRLSADSQKTFFGLKLFHFFVMALLTIFSITMIAMYFFKMRRATKLLSWLQTGSKVIPQAEAKTVAEPKDNVKSLWKGKLKVENILQETPTVKTFKLVTPNGDDLPFTYLAGQFMTLSVLIDGKPIKRAYTIASHPCDKKVLEITIKREENGLVSRYMHDVIHQGDLIDLEAASGKLTFSGVAGEGIVLIGGGVGITPLMSVLRCLISCGMKNKIYLLYACKSLDELVYHEELRQLQARNANLKLLVAIDKLEGEFPGAFEGRLTKEKILDTVPNIAALRVHLCGPPKMMEALRIILTELKVPKEQIKEESFGSAKTPQSKTSTADAPSTSPSTDSADLKKVSFKKAGKTVTIHEGETVLELSETSGIEIPFQCRVGTCGECKVKLLSGEVTMEVQDALTEEDKQSQVILACQAKAQSDLEIEEA